MADRSDAQRLAESLEHSPLLNLKVTRNSAFAERGGLISYDSWFDMWSRAKRQVRKAAALLRELEADSEAEHRRKVAELLAREKQFVIEERDRLRAALERYADHDHNCKAHVLATDASNYGCTCGLDEAMK